MKAIKLRIPTALLLTSSMVLSTIGTPVAHAVDVPQISTLANRIKEDNRNVIGKADYLPDVLGRIGYAIMMAEQVQKQNIENFTKPKDILVYEGEPLRAIGRLAEKLKQNVEIVDTEVDVKLPEESNEIGEEILPDSNVTEDAPEIKDVPDTKDISPDGSNNTEQNENDSGSASDVSESEDPEISDVPKLPDVPKIENVPELPNVEDIPRLPDVEPEIDDDSELPNIKEVPESPDMKPELKPELSDVNDSPALPEVEPEIDDTSELLNVEDIPELPETSDVPELPETLPEINDVPELPEEAPEVVPDVPEVSDIPELPNVEDIPSLPDTEDVPKLPDEPKIDDIPDELPALPDEFPEPPSGWDDIPAWDEFTPPPFDSFDDVPSFDTPPGLEEIPPFEEPIVTPGLGEKKEQEELKTDVKFREIVETVPRGQKVEYDPNLEVGQTKQITGVDGQMIKSYKDEYENGKLVRTTLVETRVTTEPINDVLIIGSKPKTDNVAKIIDLAVGETLNGAVIKSMSKDVPEFTNKTYDDLMQESEDVRFERAMSNLDLSYITEGQDGFDDWAWMGCSDETVQTFNTGNLADQKKINMYFVEYINMDRKSGKLKPIKHDPLLEGLAEIRALEMAEYGHLRYEGRPHIRPDGTSWDTVLDGLPADYQSSGFGENMLAYSVLSNPYQLVSEQWIAKRLFEQWKSSPSHYEAMMNPDYTRTGVSVKLTTRSGAKNDNGTNWMIGAELFS